jgi:hypothetical protein
VEQHTKMIARRTTPHVYALLQSSFKSVDDVEAANLLKQPAYGSAHVGLIYVFADLDLFLSAFLRI